LTKRKQVLQAVGGIICLAVGALLAVYSTRRYTEHRYIVDAAACRMHLVMLSRSDLPASVETGSVVVLHGLSANSVIMQYLARAFAELGLRVFVPDLPGHGQSPGPFTPEQAESCTASLLRGLSARGMIAPSRTILAGHSLGAAIALRVAAKFRPAGVIAISPAPMIAAHGVASQNLLFHTLPILVPNTRILVGQFEPSGLRDNAADLAAHSPTDVAFSVVPYNTHVSVLFSPTVARQAQDWAARVLSLPNTAGLPTRANAVGFLLGIIGLLLIAGPFLREMVGINKSRAPAESKLPPGPAESLGNSEPVVSLPVEGTPVRFVSRFRAAVEVALFCVVALEILHYWIPLRILHLWEGDYLASFFLIVGFGLVLLHLKSAREGFHADMGVLMGAAVAGLLLHFLITGWFELTVSGAWLTLQRWARFPLFLIATFLFFYGLELVAGPVLNPLRRYAFWFALVVLSWIFLAIGVLYLKSGEILPVLLSPYFGLEFLLSGLGVQLVRRESGSPTAAALFGAILLAGFCLVLFPLS
jgi:pimeloyl-ACP methyl ester carboxylesterase